MQIFVEKMTASQLEVSRLENLTQDLVSQRSELQEMVALVNERNKCMEIGLEDAERREEELKEEIKIAGAKILVLEESVTENEHKVCLLFVRSGFDLFIQSVLPAVG